VSNRSANKENTYSNLAAWCEKHHKDTGIKVHPSSVPVDLVLEDLMGFVAHLRSNINMLIQSADNAFNRIDEIQYKVDKIEEILLNHAANVVKDTKSTEQLKCTSTKKVK
jgi:hypothetical protein